MIDEREAVVQGVMIDPRQNRIQFGFDFFGLKLPSSKAERSRRGDRRVILVRCVSVSNRVISKSVKNGRAFERAF